MNKMVESILDTVPYSQGAELDSYGGFLGMVRQPGETDAQLRVRLLKWHPMPHPTVQRLCYLLRQLGLKSESIKNYIPVGV